MKAIIAREDERGHIAEVGTSHRIVVSHYKTLAGVRRFAKQYASGKAHRIEFFHDAEFYGAPLTRRQRAAAACIGMVIMTGVSIMFLHYGQPMFALTTEVTCMAAYGVWVFLGKVDSDQ